MGRWYVDQSLELRKAFLAKSNGEAGALSLTDSGELVEQFAKLKAAVDESCTGIKLLHHKVEAGHVPVGWIVEPYVSSKSWTFTFGQHTRDMNKVRGDMDPKKVECLHDFISKT